MERLNLAFLGYGNAARGFMDILASRAAYLERTTGVAVMVTGVFTQSHGRFTVPGGLPPDFIVEKYRESGDFFSLPQFPGSSLEFIRACPRGVLLELTPLDVSSGEPATSHVRCALSLGHHVITANKGPLAWSFQELRDMAHAAGVEFLYETAVMDGAPVFSLLESGLPGCRVLGFTGILNSTTNFILDEMAAGRDYASALAEAQARGFAEADPRLDVEGWDAACKTACLMNAWMGAGVNPTQIRRQGIAHVDPGCARDARARGFALKLVCKAYMDGDLILGEVSLQEVPLDSVMASANGTTSLIRVTTDLMGDITLVEHDPGVLQTGYGIYSDLLRVIQRRYAPGGTPCQNN